MSVKWRATLGAVLGRRPRTADMPGQFWCATSQAPSRRSHVNSRANQINMSCITFSLRYHHSGA